jgi:hypothetical protein
MASIAKLKGWWRPRPSKRLPSVFPVASQAQQSIAPQVERWIASRSLSSGAHSRDPLARNDGRQRRNTRLSSPRMRGSSTPQLLGSIIDVSGILDHPLSRVTTSEYDFAISRRISPEVCVVTSRPLCQRAQGRPGACCTRGLVCNLRIRTRTRAYRAAGAFRPSLRNGFTAYFELSPVNGSFATVAPKKLASRELNASTAASGPHDFAVRLSRTRQSQLARPSHLTARS